ncbi:MAG: hypothetical protein AAFR44_11990, partial [Pseudomonadota bacterium]
MTSDSAGGPGPLAAWAPPPAPLRGTLEGHWVVVEPLSVERHGTDLWAAFSEDPQGVRFRKGPVKAVGPAKALWVLG